VAQQADVVVRRAANRGQVLAFFAIVLPVVLLPAAAYAVDAATVASRSADLQAATAQAAETAAQQLNVSVLRSGGAPALDIAAVTLVVAGTVKQEEPGALVESSSVNGVDVVVASSEQVTLPFSVFARTTTLHARATARLAMGYESPSS
jgi:hypothetical protein